MKEVQNTLNNRPLTYVYYDEMTEPLTPNKLLYGRNLHTTNIDYENNEEETLDEEKRLRYVRTVIEHFSNRWHFEYSTESREYNKASKKIKIFVLNVGDVVLVYDDKLKRCLWKMGRVKKINLQQGRFDQSC